MCCSLLFVLNASKMSNQQRFKCSSHPADTPKSVIYGTESAILESDKFSEISLDQSDVDQQYPASVPAQNNRKSFPISDWRLRHSFASRFFSARHIVDPDVHRECPVSDQLEIPNQRIVLLRS